MARPAAEAAAPASVHKPAASKRADEATSAAAELLELPLELSARIARGATALGELLPLAPGSVVRMNTPVGEPSRLVAQGEVIGLGEVVEIKGRIAFRITRLGADRG